MKKLMLILIALVLISNISALRITPAINELNFVPGLEAEITYIVDNVLNRTLEIFTDGDLAEYVKFDKNRLSESGAFTATIKLPDEIEIPGKKRTYIGIKEIVPDAELKGGVATAVTIKAVIVV